MSRQKCRAMHRNRTRTARMEGRWSRWRWVEMAVSWRGRRRGRCCSVRTPSHHMTSHHFKTSRAFYYPTLPYSTLSPGYWYAINYHNTILFLWSGSAPTSNPLSVRVKLRLPSRPTLEKYNNLTRIPLYLIFLSNNPLIIILSGSVCPPNNSFSSPMLFFLTW